MCFNPPMDLRDAIKQAGGNSAVADAITRRIKPISSQAVYAWAAKGSLPNSEYRGISQYAVVICDLARARGFDINPFEVCPSVQYMDTLVRNAA